MKVSLDRCLVSGPSQQSCNLGRENRASGKDGRMEVYVIWLTRLHRRNSWGAESLKSHVKRVRQIEDDTWRNAFIS